MTKRALLIHGIYYFDEANALEAARLNLAKDGYEPENVTAFNWDLLVGDPEAGAQGHFNLRFLIEIGAGLLESAHLGFFEPNYQNQSSWLLLVHNFLAFLLQLLVILWPIWLFVAFLTHTKLLFGFAVVGVLLALIAIGLVIRSRSFFYATVRRVALVCLWPLSYAVMLPIFVPGSLLLLLMVLAFVSPFNVISSSVEPDGVLHAFQSFAALVLTDGLPVLVMFALLDLLPFLPLGAFAKLTADVARYIGLAKYRAAIIQQLDKQIQNTLHDENSELLLITHSLGTVIATDYLSQLIAAGSELKNITVITMGSPLERFFARFFSQLYPSPEEFSTFFASHIRTFIWINIFRKHDPIGSKIGNPESLIENHQIEEELGWLEAHLNYFSSQAVYRCIRESAHQGEVVEKSAELHRLNNRILDASMFGWSSGSFLSRAWATRRAALDMLSKLVPPMTRRYLAFCLLLVAGTIIWGLHLEHGYMQKVWLSALKGLPWPARDFGSLRRWNDILFKIMAAPVIWGMAIDPYLRLALVSVESYPQLVPRDPREENELRAKLQAHRWARLRDLAKPAIILTLLFVLLLATHYWHAIP
ncbi:MAG TPA: hypothetical protein VJP02_11735 [Candidatus Sulfotelmatobacter sp.]|nr:hypothetical protein [Candidatus Sulfotelmatobacter sp.]